MQSEFINIGLAFIEGFALIISPCILPILPIILSGSLTGSKLRPLGIIAGFIITFTVVTLFSRVIIQYSHVNQDMLRNISFAILLLLGMIMMSTYLTDKFSLLTQHLTRVGSAFSSINQVQSGFWSGFLFGGLVGIIWTPCAGPILAAIIVQVIIAHTTFSSLLVVLAFAIGAGLPMLLIALLGRRLIEKLKFFKKHAIYFRKLLGLILVLTVISLIYFPSLGIATSTKEDNQIEPTSVSLINGLDHPYQAPPIAGINAWINSKPLNLNELKGKVVLIDFWTYSCINCIRTLPYLKNWYAKYHNKGFEIIGIHSPEFQFEHDLNNVKRAVNQYGLKYPVALDNKFVTWQNFKNAYWPAHFLIDKHGDVVYTHFGEGEYDVTENNIRYLLGLGGRRGGEAKENNLVSQTPETYLGYRRAERFASSETFLQNLPADYTFPERLTVNHWALNGKWRIESEKIVSVNANASIRIHFKARKVYMVMGVNNSPVTVNILLNGKFITVAESGRDVQNSQVKVKEEQLYSIVDLKKGDEGKLEIIAINPGLAVYTFTFGS